MTYAGGAVSLPTAAEAWRANYGKQAPGPGAGPGAGPGTGPGAGPVIVDDFVDLDGDEEVG